MEIHKLRCPDGALPNSFSNHRRVLPSSTNSFFSSSGVRSATNSAMRSAATMGSTRSASVFDNAWDNT